jgi:hypothetical protein
MRLLALGFCIDFCDGNKGRIWLIELIDKRALSKMYQMRMRIIII